jgi:lysophospholipase L1-like esterase
VIVSSLPHSSRAGDAPRRRTVLRSVAVLLLALASLAAAACASDEATTIAGGPASTSVSAPTTPPNPEVVPPTTGAAPTTAAPVPPITVVVLGSSTAAGIGVSDAAESWVQRYAATLEAADPANEVVNLAVPRLTSFEVLPTGWAVGGGRPPADPAHNVTAALERGPDAIIVNLPSNDIARGYPVGELLANLDRISGTAANAGVEVWVTTTQPASLEPIDRQRLQHARDVIIGRFGDHAVNVWAGLATPDGSLGPAYDSGDGIHLNAAGHLLVSERVAAAGIPQALATP